MQFAKNIKKNTNIWDKKILVILEKNQKFTFIKYLSKNYRCLFDIYYNKEKFGLIKSINSVIKLSCNFLVKKYL